MAKARKALADIDKVLAAPLAPTEKLVLLALVRRPQRQRVTAAEIARATGLHRVTVQRSLTALRSRGMLLSIGPCRWQIAWDALTLGQDVGKLFGIEMERATQRRRARFGRGSS